MKKFLGFLKKRKKLLIIIVILAVIIYFVAKVVISINDAMTMFGGMQNSASTEEVERTDIVNSVTATGKIIPVEKRTLSSTITGVKIKEINVKVGDQVYPGDLLCLLDGEDIQEQLSDAQTMLNADSDRVNVDIQSGNRNLSESITTRDIDAKRAEQDKSDAYGRFSSAADECQEAKDAYDSACDKTSDLKGKMDAAKRELEAASGANMIDDPMAIAAKEEAQRQQASASSDYSLRYNDLSAYVSGLISASTTGVVSTWSTNFPTVENGVMPGVSSIYTGTDADIIGIIDGHLQKLKEIQSQYAKATEDIAVAEASGKIDANAAKRASAEAAYQQAKVNYESALAKEESLKATYEAKAKTVESYYDSFNQTVRNSDDRKRADDSQVAASAERLQQSKDLAVSPTVNEKRTVSDLQEKIDSCEIRANIGGIVTSVDVIQGDYYVGGAILTIENTAEYEISAQIDEYEIAKVKEGQEVIIKTNGTGTQEFKGVVKSVAPHATESMGSNAVKYEVIVSVLDHCDDFKLDMTAKIEIISDKKDGVLAVPSEAIMEDDDGSFYVEVLDGGQTVDSSKMLTDPDSLTEEELEMIKSGQNTYQSHKVTVTKGIVGDYFTEISGEGIEEGVKVVIPNEGIMSDLDAYIEEAGATGGF